MLLNASALLAAGLLTGLPASAGRAADAPQRTDWNASPAPTALYGGCLAGSSGYASKANFITTVGRVLDGVQAVTVLECVPYTGGGGTRVVGCPGAAASPYNYCLANDNDGLGNKIMLGVVRRGTKTDPYALACGGQQRIELVKEAGGDPRLINGIATIACGVFDGPGGTVKTPCPAGPSPYAYCVTNRNDGAGHAVTLGVIAANGPTDPEGLYGECNIPSTARGFAPKLDLVRAAGLPTGNVQGIELVSCNEPVGSPGLPATPQKVSCSIAYVPTGMAKRYDYCIAGTDVRGNTVVAGVITTK